MLEKKYYDGIQIHDVLCECLDDYDTILTILEKFASLPSATKADRKIEQTDCDTCKWGEWYRKGYDITMMSDECGGCCSWNNKWKPKTEPQTEYRRVGQAIDSVTGKVLGETYDVPQTDCSWQKGE